MVKCFYQPYPPRLDLARTTASKHMGNAQLASTRGVKATDHVQMMDAINSARFFLQAAEDALGPMSGTDCQPPPRKP